MVLYVMEVGHPPRQGRCLSQVDGKRDQADVGGTGVVEFRAHRPASGASQVVITYEFADMAAWAAGDRSEEIQKVFFELHSLALNVTNDLWGPSPVVPMPIRPGR